jgi:fido (protein-threonine AMPylation protein)
MLPQFKAPMIVKMRESLSSILKIHPFMLGNDRSTAVIVSAFKNFYSEKRKSFRDGKNFDEKQ